MKIKSKIMNEEDINRTLKRMAYEIIEKNTGLKDLFLVGIRSRGVPMANKISKIIKKIENIDVEVGIIDISLYRDDLSLISERPIVKGSDINFNIKNKKIVLVDDVLYTGRTVRSAIDAILDFARPKEIQFAVLIDRGHHEMPIKADFVGRNVPTSKNEVIKVSFKEIDKEDSVKVMV